MIIYASIRNCFFSLEGALAHNVLHMPSIAITIAIIMKTLMMTTMMASHLDGAVFIQIVGKGEGLASLVATGYDRLQTDDYKKILNFLQH